MPPPATVVSSFAPAPPNNCLVLLLVSPSSQPHAIGRFRVRYRSCQGRLPRSIGACGRGLENGGPPGDFRLDQKVKGLGASFPLGGDRRAKIAQPFDDGRIIERLVERGGKLVDNLLRRALGCEDARPDAHPVIDAGFLRVPTGHREAPQGAGRTKSRCRP